MAPDKILFLAVFAQVAFTFGVLILLGHRRLPKIGSGEIKISDVALSSEAWPDDVQKASNAFANQFQLPVLFYLAVGIALYFTPNIFDGVLALAFVATRIVHGVIHITTNHVTRRFWAYTAGLAILMVWWASLAIRILFLSGGAN